LGIDEVVTERAAATAIDSARVALVPALSLTSTVKFEGPADDGVPEIVPAVLSDRPCGSDPESTVQE
jgi:hypothetical protein